MNYKIEINDIKESEIANVLKALGGLNVESAPAAPAAKKAKKAPEPVAPVAPVAPVEPVAREPEAPTEPVVVTAPTEPVAAPVIDCATLYQTMFDKVRTGFAGRILDANYIQNVIKEIDAKFGKSYQGLAEIKDDADALKFVINDMVAKGL